MKDEKKTKSQLVSELKELRQRFDDVVRSGAGHGQIEQALSESEANIQSLMENARGFGVYQVEYDDTNEYGAQVSLVSPSLKEILGVENITDMRSWFAGIHPEDLERVVAANEDSRTKGVNFDESFRIFHSQKNEVRWIQVVSSPVVLPNGSFKQFNGLVIDITELKQAGEKIDKLSKVIETTSQFVVITDIEGRVSYVNSAYLDISGYAQEEVVGGSMFDFSTEDAIKKLQSEIISALLSAGHWRGETTVRKKDGTVFPTELICSLLTTESKEPEDLVAVFFDITERKQAEKELEKYRNHLEELVEDRTEELHAKMEERQELFDLMVGREVRMAELKTAIKELREQLKDNGLEPVSSDPFLDPDGEW